MTAKNSSQYADKLILGPMVRIGTLAFRLLSLRYGADLVYSEEIIDWRLLRAKRIVNDDLGIVEYVDESDGTTVFSTCQEEKSKVILQLGTSCPERALKVGLMMQNDIAGLDINMGCPKDFSLKGGMGAALLKQPEKVNAILSTLVSNLKIPVTCKIRVLATEEDTLKFCKMIESTGVSALAIHGRMVHERPQHSNRNGHIKAVAQHLNIPVIANGGSKEISSYPDIAKFKELTGCSSVMLCRVAEWNASIFRPEGKLDLEQVIKTYINLALETNTPFNSAKYTIQNMLRDQQESPFGKKFLASQTMEDICELWDLKERCIEIGRHIAIDYYRTWGVARISENGTNEEDFPAAKKPRLEQNTETSNGVILVPDCIFIRGHYETNQDLPKCLLLAWTRLNRVKQPVYETECSEKRFRSIVTVGDKRFMTNLWEKNKKQAEQAAAMACVITMKIKKMDGVNPKETIQQSSITL